MYTYVYIYIYIYIYVYLKIDSVQFGASIQFNSLTIQFNSTIRFHAEVSSVRDEARIVRAPAKLIELNRRVKWKSSNRIESSNLTESST